MSLSLVFYCQIRRNSYIIEWGLSVWILLGELCFVKLITCEITSTYNNQSNFLTDIKQLFYIWVTYRLFLCWLFTPGTDLCLHSAVWVVGLPFCCRWVEWSRAVWVGRPGVLEWRENHWWRDERVAPHCCNCSAMIWLIQSMPLSPNPASVTPCSAHMSALCSHCFSIHNQNQKKKKKKYIYIYIYIQNN